MFSSSQLKKIITDVGPAYRTYLKSLRETNERCMSAWHAGYLDEMWDAIRADYPGHYLTYFARARGLGDIKIGKSNHVKARMKTLFTGASRGLDLVACYPATSEHEGELKEEFSHLRLCGEWFRAGAEIITHLEVIGCDTRKFSNALASPYHRQSIGQSNADNSLPEATVKGEADGTLPRTASPAVPRAESLPADDDQRMETSFAGTGGDEDRQPNSNPATSSPPETGGDAAPSSLASSPTNSPAARPFAGEGTHPTDDNERGDAVRGKGSPDGEDSKAVKSPHGAHESDDFDPVRDMPAHLMDRPWAGRGVE